MPTRVFIDPVGSKKKTTQRPQSAVEKLRGRITLATNAFEPKETRSNEQPDLSLRGALKTSSSEAIFSYSKLDSSNLQLQHSSSTAQSKHESPTELRLHGIGRSLNGFAKPEPLVVGMRSKPAMQRRASMRKFDVDALTSAMYDIQTPSFAAQSTQALETQLFEDIKLRREKIIYDRQIDDYDEVTSELKPLSTLQRPKSAFSWRERASNKFSSAKVNIRQSIDFARYLQTEDIDYKEHPWEPPPIRYLDKVEIAPPMANSVNLFKLDENALNAIKDDSKAETKRLEIEETNNLARIAIEQYELSHKPRVYNPGSEELARIYAVSQWAKSRHLNPVLFNDAKAKYGLHSYQSSEENPEGGSLSNDSDRIDGGGDDGLITTEQKSFDPMCLDEEKYFGDSAKMGFFGKFYELSRAMNNLRGISREARLAEAASGLLSPRTLFLTKFVETSSEPPLPIIIRPDSSCEEIDLANMLLKDDYIILLAQVLQGLPRVTKLNVRDNKLTDRSLGILVQEISAYNKPGNKNRITDLDISENKIDSVAAEELRSLLRKADCPCEVLKMSGADIDDKEVAHFMSAIRVNTSVKDLDISHNLIGEMSAPIKVNPKDLRQEDGLVGVWAIAAALAVNSKLSRLDLSWNKIKPDMASALATVMSSSLVDVNLAYNAVGDEGTGKIALALIDNKSLRSLNLSYNRITAQGCFALSGALCVNGHLEILNISGNAIGWNGGYSLISTLNYHICEREILFHGCTFPVDFDAGIKFNPLYPTGVYHLDMESPIDRFVAMELLRLASIKRGCVFEEILYSPSHAKGSKTSRGAAARKLEVKLKRPENPAAHMGPPYSPWRDTLNKRTRSPTTLLDGIGWMKLVSKLSLIDVNTNKPYVIPTTGILDIKFKYAPRCATPIEALNATGLKRLTKMLASQKNQFSEILNFCPNIVLETYQIDEIIWQLSSSNESTASNTSSTAKNSSSISKSQLLEAFMKLIVCIRDTSNCDSLIRKYVHNQWQIKEIQLTLRSLFFVCCNAFTGHYKLDLHNAYDRLAAIRLMEINAEEKAWIRKTLLTAKSHHDHNSKADLNHKAQLSVDYIDTSQRGNKSNFRNETLGKIPLPYQGKALDDSFFSRGLLDKTSDGMLEFDFVSISRPLTGAKPITDHDLNALLMVRDIRAGELGFAIATGHSSPEEAFAAVGETMSDPVDVNAAIIGNGIGDKLERLRADSKVETDDEDDDKFPDNAKDLRISSIDNHEPAQHFSLSVLRKTAELAANFVRKFRAMRRSEGIWLSPIKHASMSVLKKDMDGIGRHILQNCTLPITHPELELIQSELTSGFAMYYVSDEINRFVTRIVLRVHSNDIKLVTFMKESLAAKEVTRRGGISGKGRKSFESNSSDNNNSRASNSAVSGPSYDPSVKSRTLANRQSAMSVAADVSKSTTSLMQSIGDNYKKRKEAQTQQRHATHGTVLEICCVCIRPFAQRSTGSTLVKANSHAKDSGSFRIDSSSNNASSRSALPQSSRHLHSHGSGDDLVHLGSLHTQWYKPSQPLTQQLPCLLDNVQPNHTVVIPSVSDGSDEEDDKRRHPPVHPTHKRFDLSEDVFIAGTYIYIKCKVSECATRLAAVDAAKRVLHKLLAPFGVKKRDIGISFTTSLDLSTDYFMDPRMSKRVITHSMVYRMDAFCKGSSLPSDDHAVAKTSFERRRKAPRQELASESGAERPSPAPMLRKSDRTMSVFHGIKVKTITNNSSFDDFSIFHDRATFGRFNNSAKTHSGPIATTITSVTQTTATDSNADATTTSATAAAAVDNDAEVVTMVWRWRELSADIFGDADAKDISSIAAAVEASAGGISSNSIGSGNGSGGYIANTWSKRFSQLRCLAGRIWLTAYQAAKIVFEFPAFMVEGQNFRELIAVMLYSRIIDLENFDQVLASIPIDKHVHVYSRLGPLNLLTTKKLCGYFELDLSKQDNRILANKITRLIMDGAGIKVTNQKYIRSEKYGYIPGWSIPAGWYTIVMDPKKFDDSGSTPNVGVFTAQVVSPAEPTRHQEEVMRSICEEHSLSALPSDISNNGSKGCRDYHLVDDPLRDFDLIMSSY